MEDLVPIWGTHPVEEFLKARPDSVHGISALPSFGKKAHQARLLDLASSRGIEISRVKVFPAGSVLPEAVHQGVVALVSPVWKADLNSILSSGQTQKQTTVVACDQITDPRNLGAILRSVAALAPGGFVLLQKRGSAQVNGTVIKASAGLAVHVRVCTVSNLVRALKILKDGHFWVFGLHPGADKALWDADISGNSVMVLGSEGTGLRKLVRQTCDIMLRIPSCRPVDSLNVSAAATVFLYEALRQDRKGKSAGFGDSHAKGV